MNTQAPAWMRVVAHGQILVELYVQKIIPNIVLTAALIALVAFFKGGLTLPNALAAVVGYAAAFMVNFYIQFARYRDEHPNLKSDTATTMGEMIAALREEYRDMAGSGARKG